MLVPDRNVVSVVYRGVHSSVLNFPNNAVDASQFLNTCAVGNREYLSLILEYNN